MVGFSGFCLAPVYAGILSPAIVPVGKRDLSFWTLSIRTMGRRGFLVYNLSAMQVKSTSEISSVERDPNLFVWFLTLVVASFYVISLLNTPSLRQPLVFLLFTGLTLVHLLLHWYLGKILGSPRQTTWYVLLQGAITFAIGFLASNQGMIYALFMGLLGEAVGMFGLTRRSLISAVYYLGLMVISLVRLTGWISSAPLLITMIPIVLFVVLFVTLYMRQTEAREQAQALAVELESANRQLAEYAARVEELTLAAERQRMARELHDTLAQGVAGLVLQLEAVKAHLEAGRGERAAGIVEQSLARARSTLADSRAAIDDLRAAPASLPEALRAKTGRFTQATGIPCQFSLALGDASPDMGTGDHLLRVLDEALTNVTRHAQASQVWVRLEAEDDQLKLAIRDDGSGFDPGSATAPGHYGLIGMRERARLLGGRVEIDSANGQGTHIFFSVPLSAGEQAP